MNAPPPKLSPPGKRISIALAVAVHLALAAFLIVGVRWQTQAPEAVEVELVQATSAPAAVPPELTPEPKPEPQPEPKPEPAPPPPKPDIAIKEKPKPPAREARESMKAPKLDLSEQLRREDEELNARRTAQAAAQETVQRQQAEAATARSRALADYSERIKGKIRGNIVLPPDLKGNPVAEFKVVQLPSGEIIDARLAKPSAHAGYDTAVERAILKSSPLPKPTNPSDFSRELNLTFCPQEPCK